MKNIKYIIFIIFTIFILLTLNVNCFAYTNNCHNEIKFGYIKSIKGKKIKVELFDNLKDSVGITGDNENVFNFYEIEKVKQMLNSDLKIKSKKYKLSRNVEIEADIIKNGEIENLVIDENGKLGLRRIEVNYFKQLLKSNDYYETRLFISNNKGINNELFEFCIKGKEILYIKQINKSIIFKPLNNNSITISGNVKDSVIYEIIPCTNIVLINERNNEKYSYLTNNNGEFEIKLNESGYYSLRIYANGFKAVFIDHIFIMKNKELIFNILLSVPYIGNE